MEVEGQQIEMPTQDEKLKFKHHFKMLRCPSVVHADFECLSSMQISRTQNVPGSSHPFDRKGQCQSNVGLSSKRLIHCGNGGFVKSDKTSNENSNRNL